MAIDLVCWDFGDTLVDERFMRIPPEGVPQWSQVYEAVLAERTEWLTGWQLGNGSINDLVQPLAERLPMSPAEISGHLRLVWGRITWFADSSEWIDRLAGRVDQAVVTVNPYEFSGIARACDLDRRVPTIVTSADLATMSKVVMVEHAREVLGLQAGLSTTVLIDNKIENIEEMASSGGLTIHYEFGAGSLDALTKLIPMR